MVVSVAGREGHRPERAMEVTARAYAGGMGVGAGFQFGMHGISGGGGAGDNNGTVEVDTRLGRLRGVRDPRKGVERFMGVPFAQPPLPPLRFKAPQPAVAWSGVLDATKHRDACVQIMPNPLSGHASEDCLYLNIFRPMERRGSGPMPVMLWIHGGAFAQGAAFGYPANSIVKHAAGDVMVVTAAYRLGSLGFLVLPEEEAHANAALLDMQMALRWVHENVDAFGGDATRVTVFGESAGGSAVALLMAMEGSKGLFHRAVIESGALGAPPVANGMKESLVVAEQAGCLGESGPEMLECLQHAELAAVQSFAGPVHGVPSMPLDPEVMWMKGMVVDIPTVIGVNELEGAFFVDYWLDTLLGIEVQGDISDELFNFLMQVLIGPAEEAFVLELYSDMRQSDGNKMALSHAIGDKMFCGWTWAQNGTEFTQSHWYQYVFAQPSPLKHKVATHFSEVPFVFGWLPEMAVAPADTVVMKNMIGWWTSLAVSGDPNTLVDASVEWLPYDPSHETDSILEITSSPRLLNSFDEYYCNAWFKHWYPHSP
eukprot:TRINITY_DN12536_c0_g1_i1.p1 TRINITY_DN12536_c0_g1~~TRINITY_DN12536_c0_g1_i1.p1  ORF type:complete len:541 (+),score=158.06 TRINITY_DN12536_c0_g1_i1:110-1732(+)